MKVRTFTPEDIPALAELRRTVHSLDHDDVARTVETVRDEMAWPDLDPARNVFVAESDEGRVVGLGKLVKLSGQEDVYWSYVTAHPDARARVEHAHDAGARLLQAMWTRALACQSTSVGRPAWMQLEVNAKAEWQIALLEQQDFALCRHSLLMLRPLKEQPLPDLVVPAGIELRPYRAPQDNHAANAASNEAFRDHWSNVELTDEQFTHMFETGHVQADASVLAWAEGEIAGVCLNDFGPLRTLRAGYPQGYVESLSVRRPWRGRGIAVALLAWTLRLAANRGLEAVSLGVDAENLSGAKQLYERVGFREEDRFGIYRKAVPVE